MAPSYDVIPSLTSVSEGQVLTTMVHTTGVPTGSLIYWKIVPLLTDTVLQTDFSKGSLTGVGSVLANAGGAGMLSFSHTIANDLKTEGPETFFIEIYSDPARTKALGTSAAIVINDTSVAVPKPPTYSVKPSLSSVNEGQTLTTTIRTTNVPAGTVLYWALTSSGTSTDGFISQSDLKSGAMSGIVTVNSSSQAQIIHELANDFSTEGIETLQFKLFTNPTLLATSSVGQTTVLVKDTSLTPPAPPAPPTYLVTASASSINEGEAITTTVQTTNLKTGTKLYWSLSGLGVSTKDFSSGSLTGFGTTDATGKFIFTHKLSNDLLTEGTETIQVKVFSDPARTQPVGNAASITVADTSLSVVTPPASPTYIITTSATTIPEGQLLTTTIKTTRVAAGTTLYWALGGTSIDNSDFSTGTMFGAGVVSAQGIITLQHTLANDNKTEGPETIKIVLYTDAANTKPVATASVGILDTSVTTAPATYTIQPSSSSANEGDSVTTSITTTNVPDGTILYYQISGTSDPLDYSVGTSVGQVIVLGGKAQFTHTLKADRTTEGDESMEIRLYSDKPGGTQVGDISIITIKDTSLTPAITTEIYQPQFTPFRVLKWASPVPVPTLKRPEYVGAQTDIWGTKFAPQAFPGGQPALYQDVDPNQERYGGIAPEFYNQNIAGTSTPYYSTGADTTAWYSQREFASMQVVVDGADSEYLTEIYGYDGTLPGSTFKTIVGQPVVVRHWNDLPKYPGMPVDLPQRESVHLHGGHNPAHTDGYPSFVINPGTYRDYYYANTVPMHPGGTPDMGESPSTMWYHDHGEDITDVNVIKGLAAFWLSFDGGPKNLYAEGYQSELDLIKNHILPGWWKSTAEWNQQEFIENNSPYDIPLAMSDRRFNADGSFFYDGFPIGGNTDGYLGDVMLVNGKSYPFLEVEKTQYRFRFLGASTARIWRLSIQDENGTMQEHLRIGNDTWLLPKPIAMKDFIMSPAQRADVVMDFSGYADGTVLYLVNTAEQTSGRGAKGDLLTLGSTGFSERVMKIVVKTKTAQAGDPNPVASPPTNTLTTDTLLRQHEPILQSEIKNWRTFEFGRTNGLWLINQTHFDSQVSNAPMPLGIAEEWKLVNGSGGWWHPIHIHLESHQVKDINGIQPGPDYFPEKQFKSDTTLLGPNTSATLWMKFRTFEGPFVFHCHILQHEDSMMMFNFDPNLDGATYKAGDYIPEDRNYTPYPYHSAHHPGHPLLGFPGTTQAAAQVAATGTSAVPSASNADLQATDPSGVSQVLQAGFQYSAWGSANGDLMQAPAKDSYLNGRDGNDYIKGNIGNDMLIGGLGDDVVSGGDGDDLIAGEIGSDMLTGGAGRDGFFYISGDAGNVDLITDFEAGQDFISINHALTNTNGANQSSAKFVGSSAFSGTMGEVRFSAGMLQVDLNGDRFSDINVKMLGVNTFDQNWLNIPAPAVV